MPTHYLLAWHVWHIQNLTPNKSSMKEWYCIKLVVADVRHCRFHQYKLLSIIIVYQRPPVHMPRTNTYPSYAVPLNTNQIEFILKRIMNTLPMVCLKNKNEFYGYLQ